MTHDNKELKVIRIEYPYWSKLQVMKIQKGFKNMTEVIDFLYNYYRKE